MMLTDLTSLGIGVVLLIGFVILERRAASPLVPLRILTERSRAGSFLVVAAAGVGLFTMFLFLSYFLQGTLHYLPIRTGLARRRAAVGDVDARQR